MTLEIRIKSRFGQISNSWFGVTGALVTGIANGGAAIYIYGSILVALVHVAVGASLGELASAYPNAGVVFLWQEGE